MIHVERARVRVPSTFRTKAARAAVAEAEAFYRLRAKTRAQRTFSFQAAVYAAQDVTEALVQLFHGKCAYCESPLATVAPVVVDHFRPRANALALDGTASPDHYWWLAYEWENLYPSCSECSTLKGSRFPTSGARARRGTRSAALARERPLLLDPCLDNPEEDLVFLEDGQVASTTERGRVTIEILGLNRTSLLEARRAAFERVSGEWKLLGAALSAKRKARRPSPPELEVLFDEAAPYAALRRQFAKEWTLSERGAVEGFLASTPEGPDSVDEVAVDVPVVTEEGKAEARRAYATRQVAQEAYSVAGGQASEEYFLRARMIERIVIRNFRVIKDLTLEFPPAGAERAAWLMLVGENGHGKSSILQAVALTLMGKAYRDRLGVEPADVVRHRARGGSVEVHLTGTAEPITLTFSRDARRFGGAPAEPKVLLLGYGATRLLPRGQVRPLRAQPSFARVDNLFNPFVPLADVTSHLLGLDEVGFGHFARALKQLLPVEDEAQLIRNTKQRRIDVETAGARVPLDQLSDGYQSVIALAADVMIVMSSRWSAMETAEGIVLIDELGAHLHPRWRMRIVKALRAVFPRLQFLVSTHDPLCLRGLANGEVAVMRGDEAGGVAALTDLPPVEGLRVDQLLTSEHFGLYSTIDPELDVLFEEYYLLKAKPRLTAAERRRRDELHSELDALQVMGTTRRDRLVLEAADEFLAKERDVLERAGRLELKKETKRRIARIWERVAEGEVLS